MLIKNIHNEIIKAGMGVLVRLFLALLLVCSAPAWAEEGSLPAGWHAEKIERSDSNDERVFYSLRPGDGRPAQVIEGSIYERLLSGEITAEAAYRTRTQVPSFLRAGETVQGHMVMPDPIYSTAVTDQQPESYKQNVNKPETPTSTTGVSVMPAASTFSSSMGSANPVPVQPVGAHLPPAAGAAAFGQAVAAQNGGAGTNTNANGAAFGSGTVFTPPAGGSSGSNGEAGRATASLAQGGQQAGGLTTQQQNKGPQYNMGATVVSGAGYAGTVVTNGKTGSAAQVASSPVNPGAPSNGCAGSNGSTPGSCNYNVGDRPETYSAAINQAAGDAGAWVGGVAGGYMPTQQPTTSTATTNK